ncbi:MAG: DUF6036 family nucleotidyltransferase [bacterium]|nr:DUF6036 family nucleotidyltransferase [bacterium]MDE0417308.1 DUF6036 family nucleotidyltransferase [bacterium]
MEELSARDIRHLFDRLNAELARTGVVGEVYLVGGAVMCLVFDARLTTMDVDAFFRPAREVREAARRVNFGTDWLNDAVKGFLSERGEFHPCLELPNLRVLTAAPEYLLAMKCMAMRIGREFHDIDDVRFLLRYLNLTGLDATLEIIGRYYPVERIPQKTIYALEEMFARTSPDPATRSPGQAHRKTAGDELEHAGNALAAESPKGDR